jgi:hypothetical protein
MADLKTSVLEIAEIAKLCPDNMQVACFELLLRHHLESQSELRAPNLPPANTPSPSGLDSSSPAPSNDGQDDLGDADLHLKVRRYLERHSLSVAQLGNLFYKESNSILPLYEDLKTTKMSESQIRIALLQALSSAISGGEFTVSVESVREECKARKSYDPSNFTQNFSNRASFFDFGDRFDSSVPSFKLSEAGRAELAEVIKKLQ